MITYALLIWIGVNAEMPASYFVLCGIGAALKLIQSLVEMANEKQA